MMGRAIGKKRKLTKTTRWLILAAVFLVAAGALVYTFVYKNRKIYPLSPGPTIEDESSRRTQEPTAQPSPGAGSSSASENASLNAPTLTKSSGNNGSVPVGATIEFVCQSVEGASCDIILTSSSNTNNVIKLGSKPINDNGRGEFAALWDWMAQKGSWSVLAQATKNGASSSSPVQVLGVK